MNQDVYKQNVDNIFFTVINELSILHQKKVYYRNYADDYIKSKRDSAYLILNGLIKEFNTNNNDLEITQELINKFLNKSIESSNDDSQIHDFKQSTLEDANAILDLLEDEAGIIVNNNNEKLTFSKLANRENIKIYLNSKSSKNLRIILFNKLVKSDEVIRYLLKKERAKWLLIRKLQFFKNLLYRDRTR